MWRFAWGTQWDATLKLGQRHLPMLMVGSLLGVAAAGLFKAAQQFSDAIANLNSKFLVPAIFPEIARLTDAGQVVERKAMMLKSSTFTATLALALILVLALFGRQLIAGIAGAAFTGAYGTMLWLAFAGFIGAATFTLEPFLLAKGDTRSVVCANALALVVHFTLLLLLLPRIGLVGAGIASVAQVGTQTLLLIGFMIRKGPAQTQIA
jgi:O-antigen/teichoic acid export membrane protein